MIYIIMGVSGCGKTTLGQRLAESLEISYFEADSFHPQENILKMSRGEPLTDEDRRPWLESIRERILSCQQQGEAAVFSCSALKESYRALLTAGLPRPVQWVYLKGDYPTIYRRMASRKGHYFKESLLKSQFADLEEPRYGMVLDITLPLEEKLKRLISG